jgi:hypothetical protein
VQADAFREAASALHDLLKKSEKKYAMSGVSPLVVI